PGGGRALGRRPETRYRSGDAVPRPRHRRRVRHEHAVPPRSGCPRVRLRADRLLLVRRTRERRSAASRRLSEHPGRALRRGAHSQGGWVAAAAIRGTAMGEEPAAGVPDPVPVRDLVLIGTFPRHERAYVLGSTGAGVVGTRAMEALMAVLRASGRTTFDPRAP